MIFSYIVIFSWIPVVLLLFATLPPRRAVIVATITAWLFLPNLAFNLPGMPDYTKTSSTTGGIVLGMLIFDPGALLRLRPRWFDLPMAIWCLVPLASSLSNGLGVYDGCSVIMAALVQWGFPYLIGRIYFDDLEGLRELAIGVVAGGLIYTPLCLFELRFSPQLERIVYGVGHWEGERFSGYRPKVFLGTGLLLGMWMTAVSLIAYWMWAAGALRRLRGISFGGPLLVLLVITLLCRSTGALTLLAFGLLILRTIRRTGWALPIWLLVAITPFYEVT
ncbi:MAG TPA: hypothetical protein VKP69_15025, partial [Isosphaeraceae bacterium]|nr:hypothetical protein [Isosphaeraceae bacterium]